MATEPGVQEGATGAVTKPKQGRVPWRKLFKLASIAALVLSVVLGVAALLAQRRYARDREELGRTAKYVNRNGQKIRYDLSGQEHPGPTIVMLSGFVACLEQWHAAKEALSQSAPVLTYDRGGYGLSDPPSAFDAKAQADELSDVARLTGAKLPLVVVGFSSSAFIARAFARQHPEQLGGLVFLDPTAPEDILGGSKRDHYDRRVLYERVPLVTMTKRLLGARSPVAGGGAIPTAAEERAAKILNFSSHWWAAYKEGAAMVESAEAAQLDWKQVKGPITLLSLAKADGPRHQLDLRFAEVSGATLLNPVGFNHGQVHSDPAFLPQLTGAVMGVVNKVRSQPNAR